MLRRDYPVAGSITLPDFAIEVVSVFGSVTAVTLSQIIAAEIAPGL
jgi:hypothetical protein